MKRPVIKQTKRARVAAAKADVEVIFVIGPPRSGTTLLSGLLTASDQAYDILPECALLTGALRSRLETMKVGSDPARHKIYAVTDERLDVQFRRLSEWFISNAVEAFLPDVRNHLILKDPNLCFIAEDLHRFFSRPIRSVYLVRDPRDVVASQMLVLERLGYERSVGDACEGILPYFEALMAAIDTPDPKSPQLAIRYEDLMRDEHGARSSLESFCNYHLNFEQYSGIDSANFDPEDPWFQETLVGSINPTRIGNFRHKLDAEEILYVEKMFEPIMGRFDYAPSTAFRQFLHLEEQLRQSQAHFLRTTTELGSEKDQLLLDLEEAGKQTAEARAQGEDLRLALAASQGQLAALEEQKQRLSMDLDAVKQSAEAAEAARQQLADEAAALQASAELATQRKIESAEQDQHSRDAFADLERRLTLAEEDRDLAVARLETLESRFLVRALLPPGWKASRLQKAGRRVD